jgi:uncharacterized PurR-regulated membrane protein YhhQ (DUF165 family)
MRLILAIVYVGAIVLANWLILHVGQPVPGGTHVLPVGFGLMAPSGTYAASLVLVLRDLLQRAAGRAWSLIVIVPGVVITAFMSPQLALASGTAFALSELADFAVYTPLQRRGLGWAVLLSATVGNLVDSTVFLALAGIPFAIAWPGLVVGKAWAILAATFVIAVGTSRVVPLRQGGS